MGGDLFISAIHSWFNLFFLFPWRISANCHANYKDADGYPRHRISIFPLLLTSPTMPEPLPLALSLLRQFLSPAIQFSLPNDSRESTLTRSCSEIGTNRPTLMHTKGHQHSTFNPSRVHNGDTNNTCMSWLDMDDLNILVSEAAMCSMNVSLSCHDSFELASLKPKRIVSVPTTGPMTLLPF